MFSDAQSRSPAWSGIITASFTLSHTSLAITIPHRLLIRKDLYIWEQTAFLRVLQAEVNKFFIKAVIKFGAWGGSRGGEHMDIIVFVPGGNSLKHHDNLKTWKLHYLFKRYIPRSY